MADNLLTGTSDSSGTNALYKIAPVAQQQQPNLLTNYGQAVGVASGMQGLENSQLQNQLMQGQLKLQAPAIDDANLANQKNHVDMMTSAIAPLINQGSNVTLDDVTKAGVKAMAQSNGLLTSQDLSSFMMGLPQGGQALQQALIQQHIKTLQASQQIDAIRGTNTATDKGGAVDLGNRNAYTGNYAPQASIGKTLTPEGAAAPQPGSINPKTGAQTMRPTGVAAEQAGLAPVGTYTGNSGGLSTAAPTQVMLDRSGRITRAPVAAGQPPAQATAGTGASPTPPGTIDTSVGPGTQAAYKASGDQYASALQNAGTYAQQQTQLQSALTGLQNTNTGPGTEARQAIASYMLALPGGIGNYLPGVDPKSIASYDEANKYLTQSASGTPNAARSDAGLNTALAASPSVHISNAAAQDVVKANIGFRKAESATVNAFQATGLPREQFADWSAQRQQNIDPRAYSFDMLSQPQRTAFMSTLDPAAKAKFLGTIRDGIANKVISPTAFAGATPQAGANAGQ